MNASYYRIALALALLGPAVACSGSPANRAGGSAFVPAGPNAAVSAPDAKYNAVSDGGFEGNNAQAWSQCGKGAKVVFAATQSHSGKYSALAGTARWPEVNGTAAICQTVTVPKNARLQFWVRQDTDDQPKYAWQEARVLDATGKALKKLYKGATQTNGWELRGPYDLSAYAGKKVTLQFSVTGTGYSTAFINQYLDDVELTNGALPPPVSPTPGPIHATTPIKHVVIVLQENRTFDNIFHGYPGTNYATYGLGLNGEHIALHRVRLMTPWDPAHGFEDFNTEYNNGAMNGFGGDGVDGGTPPFKNFAYSYAIQSDVQPYWDLAKEGVIGDDMHADHRSQSYAGHLYPIAGAAGPIAPNMQNWYVADNPTTGGSCAEPGQGEAVNILTGNTGQQYTSCFNFRTLGDLLTAKHVPWRYYVDSADKDGQVSAFASIAHEYYGSDWNNVVTPETTIFQDIQDGTLPAVSWVIGTYANSDHAGQTVPSSNGPRWVTSVFNAIGKSRYWKDSVIILVYDDWGGWYDHVKPATWNKYEPGFRIPLVVVSPYAKRGYVSHQTHYTSSILHFIENDFALGSLHTTDEKSDALDDVFDFSQAPLQYVPVKAPGSFEALFESNLPRYDNHPADPNDRD